MLHKEIVEFVKHELARNGRWSAPFRDRFEHTMRVYKWAERLQSLEGGDLRVTQIAALFHDVGWDENIPHEQVSAEVARSYLTKHGFCEIEIARIVDAVAHHNHRKSSVDHRSIETLVLMDADILDELGAISVLWDSMATALAEDPGYLKVYERTSRYLSQSKERVSLLRTKSGRSFYQERIRFIELFLDNLRFELGLSEEHTMSFEEGDEKRD